MLKYILKRIGYSLLVLLGVSLIIYFLTRLMPIDFVKNKVVAVQTSGATVDPEMVDAMYESYGLSENATFLDILKGYLGWLGDLCKFDLGISFKYGIPVTEKNALFISRNHRRISPKTVQHIVKTYLEKSGLGGQGFSTHKLRHTAATLMYQHGDVDIRVLKDILGHANLGTTQIYTHVSDKQIKHAVDQNPLSNVKLKK